MTRETFHDGRVVLHAGDCLEVLKTLAADSVDSVVTDPPYHLTSIVKRFGGGESAQCRDYDGGTGAYKRASRGFMGKQWDGGDVAFRVQLWLEVLRVLKPGGHLVAFSGTRTYHRMACAIEDAGFEIRDQIAWLYGSGFPKSHNVSKAIDRRGGNAHLTAEVGAALKAARLSRGMSLRQADQTYCGGVTLWSWYEGRPAGQQMPVATVMARISADWPELARYAALISEAERDVIGEQAGSRLAVAPGHDNDRSAAVIDTTAPSTAAARAWDGWGTALKPALEPICLARKPLSESSVAANVLAHGTGAIHVDACKIAWEGEAEFRLDLAARFARDCVEGKPTPSHAICKESRDGENTYFSERLKGRWPANVAHDGSAEVEAAFPDAGKSSGGGGVKMGVGLPERRGLGANYEGDVGYGDSGSAARFFYSAKADGDDRLGSKHPTVKPVDLMRWLARLITPPGGVVLDPFAGTGTTAEAALLEGFAAILIEREAEYRADIGRRMAHVFAPDRDRRAAIAKARPKPLGLALFGDAEPPHEGGAPGLSTGPSPATADSGRSG